MSSEGAEKGVSTGSHGLRKAASAASSPHSASDSQITNQRLRRAYLRQPSPPTGRSPCCGFHPGLKGFASDLASFDMRVLLRPWLLAPPCVLAATGVRIGFDIALVSLLAELQLPFNKEYK